MGNILSRHKREGTFLYKFAYNRVVYVALRPICYGATTKVWSMGIRPRSRPHRQFPAIRCSPEGPSCASTCLSRGRASLLCCHLLIGKYRQTRFRHRKNSILQPAAQHAVSKEWRQPMTAFGGIGFQFRTRLVNEERRRTACCDGANRLLSSYAERPRPMLHLGVRHLSRRNL
jgi:hypothetical protein